MRNMKKIVSLLCLAALCVLPFSCAKQDKAPEVKLGDGSVTITPASISIMVTETANLSAVTEGDAADYAVAWSTSDRSIVTVSKGKITGKKAGTATITANAGGFTATCEVTVKPYDATYVPVVDIALDPAEVTIVVPRTATVVATVVPANATNKPTLSWSTADASIATVTNEGVITAVAPGTVDVIVSGGNHSSVCKVTVIPDNKPTTEIVLSETSLKLPLGGSKVLEYTLFPTDHTDLPTISWSSDKPNIASVDQNGKVTATGEGDAIITAAYGNVKATCAVNVKEYAISTVAYMKKNFLPVTWSTASQSIVSNIGNITVEWLMNVEKWTNDDSNAVTTIFGIEGKWLIRIGDLPIKNNQLELAQNGGNWDSSKGLFDANKWYHVALTQNSSRQIQLFVNGELLETGTARAAVPSLTSNCFISKSYDNSRYIQGSIAEMRVWNTVRSAADIKANMYKVDPTSANLVAYWKFNEGTGKVVHDASGNGNDLTANADIEWRSVTLPED